jgi:LuxR family maltose regulon positive regulatory protein
VLLASERAREAQVLLSRLERAAREDGRHRHLLTIHIQQALAEHRLGNEAQALEYLKRALRLATSEDYVRAFLDEDPIVAEILVRTKHIAPEFVDKLLAAFGISPTPPRTPGLFESLSDRELEVLRLMAAGLSAPEIAGELAIAVSTVRTHIKHIYGKLDAHSRYEAVERARELDLA